MKGVVRLGIRLDVCLYVRLGDLPVVRLLVLVRVQDREYGDGADCQNSKYDSSDCNLSMSLAFPWAMPFERLLSIKPFLAI